MLSHPFRFILINILVYAAKWTELVVFSLNVRAFGIITFFVCVWPKQLQFI